MQILADVLSNPSRELPPKKAGQIAGLLRTFEVRCGFPPNGSYMMEAEWITL